MRKLWSSDDDTDEKEEVEEFPLKDDDPPRYADYGNYICCLVLFDFSLFTSYFGSFVSLQGVFVHFLCWSIIKVKLS